ncbi:MAG TPA: AI-2E family transporter [Burkholderiaceae bacterium]|nr:AI-2E family transporter [Burkholderiaceae bacterium]
MNKEFTTAVYATVFAIAIGWVLFIGAGIFIPIVFGVLVVYVIDGLTRLLFRVPGVGRLLPRALGNTVTAIVIMWALAAIASLVAGSAGNITSLAPRYSASLLGTIQDIAARLGLEVTPTWETLRRDLLAQVNTQRLIGSTVLSVTSIATSLVVVLLYVAFLLIEQRSFANKLANLSNDPERVANLRRILGHVNARIGTYLAMKTAVSAVQGLVSWVILALLGVEFAAFWATLIGLLNFVPYIGSVLGVLLPVAFATMQFADLNQVLLVVLALSATQFVIGFFLDPYLMANSLNLSPFVILASLAVWSALWGIAGAFLAVPITACMALVFAEFDATRPIAVLLSRDGRV